MKRLLVLILIFCSSGSAIASHLRCGYISVQRQSCSSQKVIITVTFLTNIASGVSLGGDGILSLGDGEEFTIPTVSAIPRPDLGPNIGVATYITEHTYATAGPYVVSYIEPNRNGNVLNMTDSFNTFFYTETKFELNTTCALPNFLAPPVFPGFVGSELNVSLGAASSADDLILYEIVVPFRGRNLPVLGYQQPGNLSINNLTGLLTWNTQSVPAGEYNFAVIAVQHIKEGSAYRRVGHMRMDFQVILTGDSPATPRILSDNQELDEYNRILVEPGVEKTVRIFYETSSENNPIIEKFTAPGLTWISLTTKDSVADGGRYIQVGILSIAPPEQAVRENPYLITVRSRPGPAIDPPSVSDINYLIYTEEILPLPEIITATEKEIVHVEVFPNPVQHDVHVKVNKPGKSEVVLYTMQGVAIKTKAFDTETTLMISEIPPGVYICDVRRNNTSVYRIKVIKSE